MAEEEQEMCQTCKRDIPVASYRMHTLHCARSKSARRSVAPDDRVDTNSNVKASAANDDGAKACAIKICDQCGVNVEANKLHHHRTFLCPKLSVVCKYCLCEKPAAEMSSHESSCGNRWELCERCGLAVRRHDWQSHAEAEHGLKAAFSPARVRKPKPEPSIGLKDASHSDVSDLLPCEFCEGLVPIHKLLEHQAECVNPTNVRGSSQYVSSTRGRSSRAVACEYCAEMCSVDTVAQHQLHCLSRPRRGIGLSRTVSCREPETNTSVQRESLLYRQNSFTAAAATSTTTASPYLLGRSSSFRLGRSSSVSRFASYSRQTSAYSASDYMSASRRTSVYDGYSGFAIYSSISQGLDQIRYGGRLSRRNSVTDLTYSRRPSVSAATSTAVAVAAVAAASADYSLPTLLATYNAAQQATSPHIARRETSVSRHESFRSDRCDSSAAADNDACCKAIKVQRKVSFTESKPEVMPEVPAEKAKPHRREKRKKVHSQTVAEREQKFLEQVSLKLANIQREEEAETVLKAPLPLLTTHEAEAAPVRTQLVHVGIVECDPAPVATTHRIDAPAFADSSFSSSCSSSKVATSSEASPQQRPRNRNSNVFVSVGGTIEEKPSLPSGSDSVTTVAPVAAAAPVTEVKLREKAALCGDSRSSSKRSSLDGKSVQTLALDLAAECAKAYALMESSLSKLTADFSSMGPFGMGSKSKKLRRPCDQQT